MRIPIEPIIESVLETYSDCQLTKEIRSIIMNDLKDRLQIKLSDDDDDDSSDEEGKYSNHPYNDDDWEDYEDDEDEDLTQIIA